MSVSATEPGKIVAFYSFKGGTGRSMALANVGCLLAQQPRTPGPVLMVDWDLEAPGLHRYFRKHLFGAFRGLTEAQDESPGLIDLFVELRERVAGLDLSGPQSFDSAAEMVRELTLADYVVKTDVPNLHLIKAGRFDRDYAGRVATFAWQEMYTRSPYLLRAFAERLAREYRYVLIDSRTGLTDTSGICTMLLPEILVTVFTPNLQSLSGVTDLIREAGHYRASSDDLRPLIVYPLPSRIEASEPSLRQKWRFGDKQASIEGFQPAFEAVFKQIYGLTECNLGPYFDDVQIQHVPKYAYGEETAVLVEETRDRFSLTRSYERFARRMSGGLLPWVRRADGEDDVAAEELPSQAEESKLRERLAASYLQRLTDSINGLKISRDKAARTYSLMLLSGNLTIGLGVVSLLLYWLRYLTTTETVLGGALLFVFLVVWSRPLARTVERKTELDLLVKGLEQEVSAFRDGLPPYETEHALQRLRDRVEPVINSALPSPNSGKKKGGRVYISYRRHDSVDEAGRLFDELRDALGRDRVFMDVESISPGEDFVQVINNVVADASVMIVVIGQSWADRLDDPRDFVRIELAAALQRDVRVIPVLVSGASMPRESELPDDVVGISRLHALELGSRRWKSDVARLIEALERYVR